MGGYGRIVLGFGTPYWPQLCEVVAPDLPGYGLTRVSAGRLVFSAWTSCVLDLVEAELRRDSRPVVLFGLSMGGMVAYHVACTAPVHGLMATCFVDMTDVEVAVGVSRYIRLRPLDTAAGQALAKRPDWFANPGAVAGQGVCHLERHGTFTPDRERPIRRRQ